MCSVAREEHSSVTKTFREPHVGPPLGLPPESFYVHSGERSALSDEAGDCFNIKVCGVLLSKPQCELERPVG